MQREKIEALNPLSIMDKGYYIPTKDGKVIKSVLDVSKSEEIILTMHDGKIESKVVEVIVDGKGK